MDSFDLLARRDCDTGREQTLAAHSRNAASLCGSSCRKIGLEHLGELTGLLHDGGKGSPDFQRYLQPDSTIPRGQIPHAFCGARYCYQEWGIDGTVKGLTAQLAAGAVCAHHSGLPDVTGVDAQDNLKKRAWPEKKVRYEEALENYFSKCTSRKELEGLFEESQREVGQICKKIRGLCNDIPRNSRKKAFYFQLGLVQRFLLSCLIDADRYDAYLFEAGCSAPPEPDLPALWDTLSKNLEQSLLAFPQKTPIDRKRHEISDQCFAFRHSAAGIFRLSVPTGSGKTMASLRYALNCAKENGKERIFYIAPYKSILDQNADDIRKALTVRDSGVILEHHSDVVAGNDSESGKEEAARYELLTQRWDSPIILTTAVQFLNTLFDGRSACVRRMHSLADSVLILDEVQAMPVKCTSMLNAALDFLAYVCHCAVVLCTATQPNVEELPVPAVLGTPAQMTENLEETFAAFRRTRVVDKTGEGPLPADRLAQFALERLTSCDNLLMILNTKSAAKAVFRSLEERMELLPPERRVPVCCLTTSECPQHRIDFIEKIRGVLSDQTPGRNRLICVSTQLIEAGVNLSFQCVVRSFAGLDSAAQAAGRCNRHGESACRDVFLVRCADENLSRLPDIQKAQEAASHVLLDFHSDPAQFGGDPLSPEAMRRYYHYYFELQKTRLAYPAGEKDDPKLFSPTDLFDLLSVNSLAGKYCAEHSAPLPPHPMHQAFETAGGIFQAIERGGMDVIVPYGEGESLIEQLYSGPDLAQMPKLLRQAQRYCVHLFDGERIRLTELGAIDLLKEIGAAVLNKDFYSPELGVRMQRGEMETLLA